MNPYKKLIIALGFLVQAGIIYGAAAQMPEVIELSACKKKERFNAVATQNIFKAIEKVDYEELKQILETCLADVNAYGERFFNESPLGFVLSFSSYTESRYKMNLKDKIKIVALLLQYGANPAQPAGRHGKDLPIHRAVRSGDCSGDLINVLLKADKSLINVKNQGLTPLASLLSFWNDMEGAYSIGGGYCVTCQVSAVKALIDNGADMALANKNGKDALQLAAWPSTHPKIIEILQQEMRKATVVHMRAANQELFNFPPGLLPLIADYI